VSAAAAAAEWRHMTANLIRFNIFTSHDFELKFRSRGINKSLNFVINRLAASNER